jgi:hypothetical protein
MDNESTIDNTIDEEQGGGEEYGSNEEQHDNSHQQNQESPAAKEARLKRQLNQLYKKNPDLVQSEQKTVTQQTTSGELDYGQKAFLAANGVKGSDEMKLVQEIMRSTGKKDLESVLESKYFKSELEEMRALRETANANPTSTKRAGQTSSDQVEYWIAKGEMPPKDKPQLRQQYVNSRASKERGGSPFYNG